MLPYTPQDQFNATDIYDLTDFVKGGLTGESNIPLKALLDQTQYLYNRLVSFEGVKVLTGTYTWDEPDARKLFVFNISDNSVFDLPDVTTLRSGTIIPIATRYNAIKALTVRCSAGHQIYDGMEAVSEMYMHDAERLHLVAAGSYWEVALAQGNFYSAGEDFGARRQMKNTAILNGSVFNRADLPRLAKFALSLTSGQAIVSDLTWLSDPGGQPVYRGLFSQGNGTSTLRLPDERGTFDRKLDLGRGLDNARLHAYPGGFESDEFKSHAHRWIWDNVQRNDSGDGRDGDTYVVNPIRNPNKNVQTGNRHVLENTGGAETRPKNIGKIPLIRY